MPGFNGSGPMGAGPMTGGGRGYCNPAYAGNESPMGYGRGMAYGRGFRGGSAPGRGGMRGYGRDAQYSPVYAQGPLDELNALKQQVDAINRRIKELEQTE
jgi:hypothetical protein